MNYKGYRCLDPVNNKVYIYRHVIFLEHKFSCRSLVGSQSSVLYTSPSVLHIDWSPTNVACVSPIDPPILKSTPIVVRDASRNGFPAPAGLLPIHSVTSA